MLHDKNLCRRFFDTAVPSRMTECRWVGSPADNSVSPRQEQRCAAVGIVEKSRPEVLCGTVFVPFGHRTTGRKICRCPKSGFGYFAESIYLAFANGCKTLTNAASPNISGSGRKRSRAGGRNIEVLTTKNGLPIGKFMLL